MLCLFVYCFQQAIKYKTPKQAAKTSHQNKPPQQSTTAKHHIKPPQQSTTAKHHIKPPQQSTTAKHHSKAPHQATTAKHHSKAPQQSTSELGEHGYVGAQLGDEDDGGWRGRSFVHVLEQLGSSELPLNVRLGLDVGISIGHHSNEQVDQSDHSNKHVKAYNALQKVHTPPRLIGESGHVVRVNEAEEREEEYLESSLRGLVRFGWVDGDGGHVGWLEDREVDGRHLKGEA